MLESGYGWLSLVPTLVVLLVALISRKTFEALLVGCFAGFIMLSGSSALSHFTDVLVSTMQDDTVAWIVLVCALFGSLINMLIRSGGSFAFARWLLRFVKKRQHALLATWALGLCIFIDDYLNSLTVGTSMKKITDKFLVSREMLAYVVDSTAAPICVLVPLSTWAIYISGLLENNQVAATGEGLATYIQVIPFILYSWFAVLIVPMVAMGWLPLTGPMRKAELRARKTGVLKPPKSEAISFDFSEEPDPDVIPRILNFILPVLVLIAATVYFDIDALKGIFVAVAFATLLFWIQKLLDFAALSKAVFDGIKSMIYPLAIIIMSFVLKVVNDELMLTEFIIGSLEPWLKGAWLPVFTFITLSLITFSTGSFWGVFAISFPIIIPLAKALDVHMMLAIGSVISSGAFGSHACFYGDSTVLSATSAGCNNMAHATTQLPYSLFAAALTALIYIYLGFVL